LHSGAGISAVLTALPAVVAAVADLALIIVAAPDMSFDRGGMSPQRISQRGRPGWKPANTTPNISACVFLSVYGGSSAEKVKAGYS